MPQVTVFYGSMAILILMLPSLRVYTRLHLKNRSVQNRHEAEV